MNLPRLSKPVVRMMIFLGVIVPGYLTIGRLVLTHGLFIAAERGDVVILRLLLISGVSIDFHDRNVRNGGSAIGKAAQNNHFGAVSFLLQQGANPNIQDNNNYSPLIWATMNGDRGIVDLLIRHHANLNLEERCRMTAYDWALQKNYSELARKLKAAGGRKGPGGGCG